MGNDLRRMDPPALMIGLAFTLIPALLMLWQARRSMRGDLVGDWARAHYLAVPDEHRRAVAAHLRRLSWLRGLGAATGWVAGSLVGEPFPAGPWGGVLVGYVVAAVAGEATAQRRLGAGVASLAPRRLEGYVPPTAVVATRAVAAVAIVVGVLPLGLERHRHAHDGAIGDGVVIAVALLSVAVLGEWLTRWIVARRQTAGTPELLEVDDALRSTSAHLLMASILAIQLLGLATVAIFTASTVAAPALRWAGAGLALGAFVGAYVCLHLLAGRPWRVRRELAATEA